MNHSKAQAERYGQHPETSHTDWYRIGGKTSRAMNSSTLGRGKWPARDPVTVATLSHRLQECDAIARREPDAPFFQRYEPSWWQYLTFSERNAGHYSGPRPPLVIARTWFLHLLVYGAIVAIALDALGVL